MKINIRIELISKGLLDLFHHRFPTALPNTTVDLVFCYLYRLSLTCDHSFKWPPLKLWWCRTKGLKICAQSYGCCSFSVTTWNKLNCRSAAILHPHISPPLNLSHPSTPPVHAKLKGQLGQLTIHPAHQHRQSTPFTYTGFLQLLTGTSNLCEAWPSYCSYLPPFSKLAPFLWSFGSLLFQGFSPTLVVLQKPLSPNCFACAGRLGG